MNAYVDDETSETDPRAADAALELMKQLITLSSGVLALSAAFIDKFRTSSWPLLILLAVAWIALIVSVFFGLETISAIVKSRLSPDHDWSAGYGKAAARVCKYCFVAGLAAFATFAFIAFITAHVSAVQNNQNATTSPSRTTIERPATKAPVREPKAPDKSTEPETQKSKATAPPSLAT